jgi:hypothetical protein
MCLPFLVCKFYNREGHMPHTWFSNPALSQIPVNIYGNLSLLSAGFHFFIYKEEKWKK